MNRRSKINQTFFEVDTLSRQNESEKPRVCSYLEELTPPRSVKCEGPWVCGGWYEDPVALQKPNSHMQFSVVPRCPLMLAVRSAVEVDAVGPCVDCNHFFQLPCLLFHFLDPR